MVASLEPLTEPDDRRDSADGCPDPPDSAPDSAPTPLHLDLDCIAECNLDPDKLQELADVDAGLQSLTHIRLEDAGLTSLELEGEDGSTALSQLPSALNLYLHHNYLTKMEAVAALGSLRFLTVAHNRITRIAGVAALTNLMFCDLSYNLLSEVQSDQLPQSLRFLQLAGNTALAGDPLLVVRLTAALPHLKRLDDMHISEMDRDMAGRTQTTLGPQSESETGDSDSDDNSDVPMSGHHLQNILEEMEAIGRDVSHAAERSNTATSGDLRVKGGDMPAPPLAKVQQGKLPTGLPQVKSLFDGIEVGSSDSDSEPAPPSCADPRAQEQLRIEVDEVLSARHALRPGVVQAMENRSRHELHNASSAMLSSARDRMEYTRVRQGDTEAVIKELNGCVANLGSNITLQSKASDIQAARSLLKLPN